MAKTLTIDASIEKEDGSLILDTKKGVKNIKQILKNYPINSVKEFERLIGVMVMEHAENSIGLKAWQELAKRNEIRILFYKSSLMYENIA